MGAVSAMNEDGIAIRVTMSYDHDYLGAKFTLDTLYGVAEMRDSHGVAVSTDEIKNHNGAGRDLPRNSPYVSL